MNLILKNMEEIDTNSSDDDSEAEQEFDFKIVFNGGHSKPSFFR